MGIKKRGILFTFAAMGLALILIFSLKVYNNPGLKDKVETIEIRVNTMNNLIKDMENDMQNAISIVGFRSLLGLEDYMMQHGRFLNDAAPPATPSLSDAFEEVFRDGTINSEIMTLMENNTFINWTEKIKAEAAKTDITLGFTVNDVTITQTEPWKVDITVDLRINVQDGNNVASWVINKEYTEKINITNFVDPLYLVNTNGVANNTIRETIYTNWPSDLSAHLTNAYYRKHTGAPSYLDRFENDLSGSAYGIESLVTQKLKDEGLPVSSKSAVDYIYFSTSNPSPCNVVDIADTDFYLDDSTHTTFYGTSCVS